MDPNEQKLVTKTGRVTHSARPSVSNSHGVHVTVKLHRGIPNLRQKHVIEALERCFSKAKDRFGFQLTAYTVMSNHCHFLVYVSSNEALRRGMQGLNIRLARTINRLFDRKSKVFADRFHARMVRGFNAIKKALRYVVQNARKHQLAIPAGKWDRYSSGHYRNSPTTQRDDLPMLKACGSFLIMCATMQLLPSEFPGPHNRADPIH
ncbi:MAG: REP element-mobilizing transposase RayT [Planctomycetota bacterium]